MRSLSGSRQRISYFRSKRRMTSKKPLNFAQALRVKPGEAKDPPLEPPKEELNLVEVAPPSMEIITQSVASHPATQLPEQTEEISWQATQPPIETLSDSWQATQPPIPYEQTGSQPS